MNAAGAYPDEGAYFKIEGTKCVDSSAVPPAPCDDKVPVCDYYGEYYANQCALNAAGAYPDEGAYFKIDGTKCVDSSAVPPTPCDDKVPVCDYDGVYYANQCALNAAGAYPDESVNYKLDGTTCVEVLAECGDVFSPVCSVDGVYYENECRLNYDASVKDKDTFKIDGEECVLKSKTCGSTTNPVCSDDGTYFDNRCSLVESGKTFENGKYEVENKKCVLSSSPCLSGSIPVCSSDGKWFANKCLMKASGSKHDDGDHKVQGKTCVRVCK